MATAADLGGHMYNWLQRVGFPVRDFTTEYGNLGGPQTASGYALPGRVGIDPRLRGDLDSVAARLGTRGKLTKQQIEALRVLTHESVHQMRYGRTPEVAVGGSAVGTPGGYEEAATEAVTQDLLPIFTAKMYGDRLPGARKRAATDGLAYGEHVNNLRQLSVFGSGAKKYTDYNARVWRRSFLHADAAKRQELVDQATQARVAWGQTSGRDKPKYAQPKPKPKQPVRKLPRNGTVDFS